MRTLGRSEPPVGPPRPARGLSASARRRPSGSQLSQVLGYAAAALLGLGTTVLLLGGSPQIALGLALSIGSLALVRVSSLALVTTFLAWGVGASMLRRAIDDVDALNGAGPTVYLPMIVITILGLARVASTWDGRRFDRLDLVVVALAAVMILGMVAVADPIGGLTVGPVALLPLAWYWIGRTLLESEEVQRLFTRLGWMAVAVAVVGLAQTFGHFFAFDRSWADSADFSSLQLGGSTRAFGTLSSPAEYSRLLAMGIFGLLLTPRRRTIALPARVAGIAMLSTALLYSGVRSALALLALGLVAVVAVAKGVDLRLKLAVAFVGCMAAVVLLNAEPTSVESAEPDSAAAPALARQLGGIQEPLGDDSTLDAHISGTVAALGRIPERPFGEGTISLTPAAGLLGENRISVDGDVARAATAWGIAGLIAFIALLVVLTARLWSANRRLRSPLGPLALAVSIVLFLQWLNPGFYVVPSVFWLLIGALVASTAHHDALAPASVGSGPPSSRST